MSETTRTTIISLKQPNDEDHGIRPMDSHAVKRRRPDDKARVSSTRAKGWLSKIGSAMKSIAKSGIVDKLGSKAVRILSGAAIGIGLIVSMSNPVGATIALVGLGVWGGATLLAMVRDGVKAHDVGESVIGAAWNTFHTSVELGAISMGLGAGGAALGAAMGSVVAGAVSGGVITGIFAFAVAGGYDN